MVVSTGFWSRLFNVSSVLTSLKYTAKFDWASNALLVCWNFTGVLGFRFWSLCFWNMSFFVFILYAIFCVTNFFIFQDIVWLVKPSWCVHYCSIHQFYWVSDRCRSGFAPWSFFIPKKNCRHKLVVSTSVWSRLLNVYSVLTSLKYAALFFWFVNALWVCWLFIGRLGFGFWYLCFWNMSFLCLFLMPSFVVQTFSFFRTLCGYLSHLDVLVIVQFISSTGLAIVAEADLLCGNFLSAKSCRHKLVVSTSFWCWLLNVISVLTSLKYTATIVWVFNALWGSWEY